MKSAKTHIKLLIACIALVSIVAFLKAGYYKPDFFPIGLTGLNHTGYPDSLNCPYSNAGASPRWTWDRPSGVNSEKQLIFSLGVNCIGHEDAYVPYLTTLDPDDPPVNNYLRKVCKASFEDVIEGNEVYLITAGYFTQKRRYRYEGACADPTKIAESSGSATWIPSNSMFRSYSSTKTWGSESFNTDACYGPGYDNWETCDGDDLWRLMVDEAVDSFRKYFTENISDAQYVWGYNLISENPAFSRNNSYSPAWHGCWAAVDRVFTGHNYSTSWFQGKGLPQASHDGIRGAEDAVGMSHRMFTVKCETWPLHKSGYNIFQYLPDLDALVVYEHSWCHADWNYGDQRVFERLLYDWHSDPDAAYQGYHNTAIYMQQYGNTPGGPAGQERRWIAAFTLEWRLDSIHEEERVYVRRPCPPEIRCATYLSLSRGAKGILWHPWLCNPDRFPGFTFESGNIEIPQAHTSYFEGIWVGLRDQQGYPFGESTVTHYLNNGVGNTYWHDHNRDTTYNYLAHTLIPEIKRLAPWLVTMSWDTAFSRDCYLIYWPPVRYVMACRTRNIFVGDYVDVGFFKDPAQVDYFMVVNRSRIADYKLAKIRIELDKDKGQNGHLWITDLYDTTVYDLPHVGGNPNNNHLLDMNFQPGQGRLFAISSDVALTPKPPKLWVYWIPYKTTFDAFGHIYFGSLGSGMWWARLDWTFDKAPWDFQSYEAYRFGYYWGLGLELGMYSFWNTNDYYTHACTDTRTGDLGYPPYYFSGQCGQWRVDAAISKGGNTTTLQSNTVSKCAPGDPPAGGCPTVYTLVNDSLRLYAQCNSILPHSEFACTTGVDMLVLNAPPQISNGHYHLNISEDTNNLSHIDELKLWVVDHPEGTEVATTADGQIFVYSDVVLPYTCDDQNLADRLDKMREPSEAFSGSTGGWLELSFPDYGWASKALLVSTGLPSEERARQKNNEALVSVQDSSGNWVPRGYAFTRHNPCAYLADVSDDTMGCYRLDFIGDSVNINYVCLVKLDSTDVTITEAPLDSALKWSQGPHGWVSQGVTGVVRDVDQQEASIECGEQIAMRFDSVRTIAPGFVRDFVFEAQGVYTIGTVGGGPQSDTVKPIPFSLEVRQNEPLGKASAIRYSLPYATEVRIAVYDIQGRLVTELIDSQVKAGYHRLDWQGSDDTGRKVSAGIYFVKMTTLAYNATKKVVILR